MTSPGVEEAFTITTMEGVGRCLVAARDISALEEILVDQPALLAPYYEPEQPLCLECLCKTDGSVSCPSCSLTLCGGEECQADSGPLQSTDLDLKPSLCDEDTARGKKCLYY